MSFTVYWKEELLCSFHYCHAREAHSPGAFILTEFFEGGITLLSTFCIQRYLSSEPGALKLSDLPDTTQTPVPKADLELWSPSFVYTEKSAIERAPFSDKLASQNICFPF